MQTFERDCRVIVEATDLTFSNDTTIIHVLHVDDDPSILEVSKLLLMDMGNFEIDSACCVDEAFRKLATGHYDVVISDYEMPQKDGLQFLSELRKQNSEISFMLFTGKGREEVAIKALNLGGDDAFRLPSRQGGSWQQTRNNVNRRRKTEAPRKDSSPRKMVSRPRSIR